MALSQPSILITDDDRDILEMYGLALSNAGFDVIGASNGKEALKTLKEKKVSLLILDIVMPEMDGFELLKKIKKDDALKNIPVIIFTNLEHEKDKEEAKKLGADSYVLKTAILPSEFAHEVKKFLHLL